MPTQPSFPVGTAVKIKIDGILTDATYDGWSDRYMMPMVKLAGGRRLPRKIFSVAETQVVVDGVVSSPVVPVAPTVRFDINRRFTFLEQLVDMVVVGSSNSLLVTGPGGLGKTHTVMERVKMSGLKEEDDFKVIKGFSTPKSLYRAIYESSESLLIFDDCDSVLEHATSLNILKGALDSHGDRRINWLTERSDDALPDEFCFRGSIIFISNKNINEIDQPILSRALFVDLTMTADEKIERMAAILTQVKPEVSLTIKRECLDLLRSLQARIGDLNIRTLLKIIDVRIARPDAPDWAELAEYCVTAA